MLYSSWSAIGRLPQGTKDDLNTEGSRLVTSSRLWFPAKPPTGDLSPGRSVAFLSALPPTVRNEGTVTAPPLELR